MAITRCPQCSKRISDKAPVCPYCGLARDEDSDPEVVETILLRRRRQRRYRLKMFSYVALSVFMAGLIWYWFQSDGFQYRMAPAPGALMGLGVLGYFVIRILMVRDTMAARRED